MREIDIINIFALTVEVLNSVPTIFFMYFEF